MPNIRFAPLLTFCLLAATGLAFSDQLPNLQSGGFSLRANMNGDVCLYDRAGDAVVTMGGIDLVWGKGKTDGGLAKAVTLSDNTPAIETDYNTTGDQVPATLRIQSRYTLSGEHLHYRNDIWGPDDLNVGGTMMGRQFPTESVAGVAAKVTRWTRDTAGGIPFEVPDGAVIVYKTANRTIQIVAPGSNSSWEGAAMMHCPATRVESGHFVAEGDVIVSSSRPATAAAIAAGRPVALDIWTDHPYNIWDNASVPFAVHAQVSNTSSSVRTIETNWWARDYDGNVVGKGSMTRGFQPMESYNTTLHFPTPKRGMVFVEVDVKSGSNEVFRRTNLAVVPPYHFESGDESVFGISAMFPLPTQADAVQLLQRIGVRWLRSTSLSGDQARSAGLDQNYHTSTTPNGKTDQFSDDPTAKKQWIDDNLKKADAGAAHYWEVFNEWNSIGGYGKGQEASGYVSNWLQPIRSEKQQTGAKVQIMSMGLAGMDTAFATKMHDAGGWDLIDAFGLHVGRGNYTADYPGDTCVAGQQCDYWNFLESIRTANSLLAKFGPKPLWITEVYACTQPNSWWHDSFRHAAENVVLQYALAMEEGVRVMDWYQLNDGVWYDQSGVDPTNSEYYYGLLSSDLSPKPSLLAYQTIAKALDRAVFVRWMRFPDPMAKGLLFDTPKGPVAVLWNRADGMILNTNHVSKAKTYSEPEPWVETWKTRTPVKLLADKAVTVVDCIGRETVVPCLHGAVTVMLDGAPRIVYGLARDAAR